MFLGMQAHTPTHTHSHTHMHTHTHTHKLTLTCICTHTRIHTQANFAQLPPRLMFLGMQNAVLVHNAEVSFEDLVCFACSSYKLHLGL